MTTTTPAARGPRLQSSRILATSIGWVLAAVLITAGTAELLVDRPATLGALTGGGIAVSFFALGSAVVSSATRVAPQVALLVALLTYTLQVALVALVFAALVSSGALGTSLSRGWLAGAVAIATAVWTASQIVGFKRARVPAYDLSPSMAAKS